MRESNLKIWWIPQIPMDEFERYVSSPEEARVILQTLADYDLFQMEHNIKPDYCNAGGLLMWNERGEDWEEWYDDDDNDIWATMEAPE